MKIFRMQLLIALALVAVSGLSAQSSLKGMSLNGATGLYSIPTGRIGWERSSDLGLDLGYHAIIRDNANHIPKIGLSLFKWVELTGAVDVQPGDHQNDLIAGVKIQFPLTSTAIALGGNFQGINTGNPNPWERYSAGQIYVAVTYAGQFFTMPAETTVVVGKTFIEGSRDSNIDFGMGFDLILLPKVFQNYIHWITDFANFTYSVDPFGAGSQHRGTLNTGFRIDLSEIPALNKFKFVVDIFLADAFDEDRAFSVGLVFGIPIL
ncbi:hypothetical protein [Leadbettera azotonutricia]|uniref:Transporter n=1 Tax=Leadbettera azotonutricia (strain ATCC BAA-888 / DSM 13862 / ZAS-9) TaxID=545695 RepID=F5YE91_LEAAZ|nr:hypothetical protein [Leadbettera azotonutricia]AEF83061.1 hypothetical protein TREAZ_0236 [Leadbettera azotonutricia ZAS-9]